MQEDNPLYIIFHHSFIRYFSPQEEIKDENYNTEI
jgi:hypothetical protein